MKDSEIIDLYWARDQRALTETDMKYGVYCRTIADNILRDPENAEECVNDTWLNAWRSMPPHKPGILRIFLGRITRNLSLNRLKYLTAEKRSNSQGEIALSELSECVPSPHNVEREFDRRELTRIIEDFLVKQNSIKRIVFVRRYWYMDPINDIADKMGISQSKTASILFRMRKDLKDHLEKEGIEL